MRVKKKACSKCGESKSLDDFYSGGRKDGTRSACILCSISLEGAEKIKLGDQGLKRCVGCEEIKPLDDFHRKTASKDGRRARCKICEKTPLGLLRGEWKSQGLKRCSMCENLKPLSEFRKCTPRSDGLYAYCKYCEHATAKIRRDSSDRNRAAQMKSKYGISLEEWDSKLASQGGVCALCKTAEPGGQGRWHVDHDHSCCPGRRSCGLCIRGLLCSSCNLLLGIAHDDVVRLEFAIQYLKGALR